MFCPSRRPGRRQPLTRTHTDRTRERGCSLRIKYPFNHSRDRETTRATSAHDEREMTVRMPLIGGLLGVGIVGGFLADQPSSPAEKEGASEIRHCRSFDCVAARDAAKGVFMSDRSQF